MSIMSTEKSEKIEKYDLWRPVVRPERRDTLDHLHQGVGLSWSQGFAENFGRGATVICEASSFEPFQRLCEAEQEPAEIAAFVLERAQASGLMLVSRQLTRSLIDLRLGAEARPATPDPASMTPLESALGRDASTSLLAHLSQSYAANGLGELKVNARGDQLQDLGIFDSEDYVIVFRYAVSGVNIDGYIVVALSTTVANAVAALTAPIKVSPQHTRLRSQAAMLPVAAEILLGSWTVPIQELIELRPGDTFPLPGADEGALTTGGGRLLSLKIDFEPRMVKLWVRRHFRES
jgi:flagellar motor switch protein FliM